VSHTLDMFMDYDLKISAEVLLEVSHNLLSKSGEKGKIKKNIPTRRRWHSAGAGWRRNMKVYPSSRLSARRRRQR